MALPIVDEQSIPALDLPGRMLRWVVTGENIDAKNCSMCVIEVQPGQTVKPAHSHPQGEEVIYLLSGSGRVWIDGEIGSVKQGCAVLFPQGKIHMLQNTSAEVMKVACFFAPGTSLDNYRSLMKSSSPSDSRWSEIILALQFPVPGWLRSPY